MKINDIIQVLESLAPPALQENYDNSGLITGNKEDEVTGAIVCLDSTEEVLNEAIAMGCNLIIAHHPIIFSGLKKITGKTYVERIIIKAIKNNLAIYAIHTNLDNVYEGVNLKIASRLSLINTRILAPKENMLVKLVTFVPEAHAGKVQDALFAAGGGAIGNYSECSFSQHGTGSFKAGKGARPFTGELNMRHMEPEIRVEVIFETYKLVAAEIALKMAHPYEEVAFDLYTLINDNPFAGSGLIGELEAPVKTLEFIKSLKDKMLTHCVRYTKPVKDQISRVAVCGGSGSFLLPAARSAGADIFITADYK